MFLLPPLLMSWGHGFPPVCDWLGQVIVFKFSVLVGCPFLGLLARGERLFKLNYFLSIPLAFLGCWLFCRICPGRGNPGTHCHLGSLAGPPFHLLFSAHLTYDVFLAALSRMRGELEVEVSMLGFYLRTIKQHY